MRYLSSVYVRDYQARIGYKRGSLMVSTPDQKQRIPIESVDAVVLFGGQITTQAMSELARRNIRVAALTRGGTIKFTVHGPAHGNVHLRQAQHTAVADPSTTLDISRNITAAKLQNSRHVISRWARDHPDPAVSAELHDRSEQMKERIGKVAGAHTSSELRGIEGDAGRLHFGAVRAALQDEPLTFNLRTRRPPRDPVNAVLGFCYALTTTETAGAAETVGLDPQIGFLHRARSGRASLALDLVEEMRPVIDRFVVGVVRRKQLRPDDFIRTRGGACYLSDHGRDKLINLWEQHKDSEHTHHILGRKVGRWALPLIQATLLARHLRGDLVGYPPYLIAW